MINETQGKVFSVAGDNTPVAGCTVSKAIATGDGYSISHFSLADKTDISAEIYRYPKLILMLDGMAEVYSKDNMAAILHAGEAVITPTEVPVGVGTETGVIYTEIAMEKEFSMNTQKEGMVFQLKDVIPYQEGKIVNKDIINDDHLKLVVMSFAKDTGLAEHAAPGDALLFALDGSAVVTYEGIDHRIQAGENFKFAKNGRHAIKADENFKMALLLTID